MVNTIILSVLSILLIWDLIATIKKYKKVSTLLKLIENGEKSYIRTLAELFSITQNKELKYDDEKLTELALALEINSDEPVPEQDRG